MDKRAEAIKIATIKEAVFPCKLKIFEEYIFNKKDPIVLGVEVTDGSVRIGTPIVVPSKEVKFRRKFNDSSSIWEESPP